MNKKAIHIPRLFFFFLLLIIAITYSNSLYSPFILDDFSAFIRNPNLYVDDFSVDSLSQLIHTRFGKARLIPIFTFALDHYLGKGQSMVYYHATNIVIHLLTTGALAMFVAALLRTKAAADTLDFFLPAYFVLAVCGIWSLAPVQTNAVTYLVQRMTSIVTLFYLAACAFYIYARLVGQFWQRLLLWCMFFLAAVCAFFSKENSAALPAAILLIECMFVAPGRCRQIIRASRWYHWLIIVAVILLVFPLIQYKWDRITAGFSGRHFSLSERLLTQPRILVFYISLLLLPLPSRMNLDHDFSLSTAFLSPPATLASLIILTVFLGIGFRARKTHPLIAFGIFWFFLNLFLESSFVPLELIFEHRLYLPSVGFFITGIAVIDFLLGKYGKNSHPEIKKIVFLVFIVILSVSSLLTTARNYDWRDRVALYGDCFAKSPNKARAATNYAMALGREGQYEECVKYGLLTQRLGQQGYEDYMNAATNTLTCLLMQEKYDEAAATGEMIRNTILQKNMEYISAGALHKYMFNLGRAFTEVGEYKKAMDAFQISLFRNPGDVNTFDGVNKLLLLAQQEEKGRQELNISEEKYEIPKYLVKIAMRYRQYRGAAQYLREAQQLNLESVELERLREGLKETEVKNRQWDREANIADNPTYSENSAFRLSLKTVDIILDKYWPLQDEPAGWLLMQAQDIDKQNPFLPVFWARWHMKNNRIDQAISVLEDYLQQDENFVPVLEQLGLCYQEKKEYQKSIEIFEKILDIYPGNPNWKNYLTIIYQYKDKLEESSRTTLDYY